MAEIVPRAALRAAAFVDAHGDASARLHAAALIGRAPVRDALAALDPDAGDAAALRWALARCDDLRALGDPRVKGWAEGLAATQGPDGGFAAGCPLEARLFETGMVAGHLAKTRYARPALLRGAADFLAGHWSPERVRAGSWRAITAYAHLFSNADHDEADAILQWCGRELGRAFATRAFDAARTARVLVYCDAHGLPGSGLRRDDLVVALLGEQASDGGFPAWEGEGARDAVAATLDALVALSRLA